MSTSVLLADVDGTLLDATGAPWRQAFHLVDAAAQAGWTVALCSARPHWSLSRLAAALGPAVTHTVAFQGALISERPSPSPAANEMGWNCLQLHLLPDQVALALAAMVGPRESLWWYSEQAWYVRQRDDAAEAEAAVIGRRWTRIIRQGTPSGPLLKMLMVRREQAADLATELRAASLPILVSLSQPGYVEIVSDRVSTDKGLTFLRSRIGDGAHCRMVAIGDGQNDLGMVEGADVGVTFDDAPAEVKRVADIVLPKDRVVALSRFVELIRTGAV